MAIVVTNRFLLDRYPNGRCRSIYSRALTTNINTAWASCPFRSGRWPVVSQPHRFRNCRRNRALSKNAIKRKHGFEPSCAGWDGHDIATPDPYIPICRPGNPCCRFDGQSSNHLLSFKFKGNKRRQWVMLIHHRQHQRVFPTMPNSRKIPQIIDYGGRRRKYDRRLNVERPTVPESRSGRQRRCGYDRRSIKNNARFKVKAERRIDFERFRKMIPEEEKIDEDQMIFIDYTADETEES